MKKNLYVIVAINISLWIAAAIISGHEYELLFPTLMLLPGAILSGYLLTKESYFKCVKITALCALAADLIWIVFDVTFIAPTSHNLAPLELIATGIFSLGPGILGVGIGRISRRIKGDTIQDGTHGS